MTAQEIGVFVFILIAGTLGTDIWRWLGVFGGKQLSEESEALIWVRSVATALVAGVIASQILYPGGVLAGTPMILRIGAAVAGLAGTLWAIDTAFVATDSIDLQLSTTVIIITFLGGSNWFLGPIVGGILYIILSDWLSGQTAYWQIWIGLLFIAIVLVFPSGLSGAVAFICRRLFAKEAAQ